MYGDVGVSLFVSVVFFDVVHVIPSDNNGSGHGFGNNDSFNDFSSDGNIGCEGTFFVNIGSFDGFSGGFNT